jgi:hypothetical protein
MPVEMRNSTAASRMWQPIRVPDADHSPGISSTPLGIVPTHPGFRTPSRTERLLQAALGKDFKMPPAPRRTPAESLAGPASDASVINAAEQVGSESIPNAKIAEVTVPAAITPPVADSPATPSPLPAIEPRIDLNRDSPLAGGRAEKPTRSYTATAQPEGIILHVSPNIQTNPLVLPRATLELAKRPPNPDSQVIRQPR